MSGYLIYATKCSKDGKYVKGFQGNDLRVDQEEELRTGKYCTEELTYLDNLNNDGLIKPSSQLTSAARELKMFVRETRIETFLTK